MPAEALTVLVPGHLVVERTALEQPETGSLQSREGGFGAPYKRFGDLDSLSRNSFLGRHPTECAGVIQPPVHHPMRSEWENQCKKVETLW